MYAIKAEKGLHFYIFYSQQPNSLVCLYYLHLVEHLQSVACAKNNSKTFLDSILRLSIYIIGLVSSELVGSVA